MSYAVGNTLIKRFRWLHYSGPVVQDVKHLPYKVRNGSTILNHIAATPCRAGRSFNMVASLALLLLPAAFRDLQGWSKLGDPAASRYSRTALYSFDSYEWPKDSRDLFGGLNL